MRIFNYIEIEITNKGAESKLEHFSDDEGGLIFAKIFPRPLCKDPGISGSTMEDSLRHEWYLDNWGSSNVYGCFKFSRFGNIISFGFISEDNSPDKLVTKISEFFIDCPITHFHFIRKNPGAIEGDIIRRRYFNGRYYMAESTTSDGSLVKDIFGVHELNEQKNIFTVLE